MHPRVKVKQGTVIGGTGVLPNGNSYNYFKGIPYAVPPLGKLRFKAPVPLERFKTAEICCTKEGNVPCQFDNLKRKFTGSEDCLFLNVFSPQTREDGLLPVMVYIYGGAFISGSGNSDLYNPLYLMQEGVVVVTFNYRLGVLGFLEIPEANVPGNAGLKDQRLALEWVHENISQFNGDPNNVTLFGESAGAACVHIHVLSKGSRHLVHKAILQSGAVEANWAFERNPEGRTENLIRSLGCTSDDPFEKLDFLQNFPDLEAFLMPLKLEWSMDIYINGYPVGAAPILEKDSPEAVLTPEALESLHEENSLQIPLLMGYNSADGLLMLNCLKKNLEYYDTRLDTFIPKDIRSHLTDQQVAEVVDKIRDFYFQGEKLGEHNLQSFCSLLTDYFFVRPISHVAEIHSKKQHKAPLYFYRFDVDESLNLFKKRLNMNKIRGAGHVDDVFYIFQSNAYPEPWDKTAKNVVLKMCKMWANFAKYGNPTLEEDGDIIDCIWEPVRQAADGRPGLNALIIDRKLKMVDHPDGERVEFWKNIQQQYATL